MPLVLGLAYIAGLYGFVALAYKAGQTKSRNEFGGEDFYERGWYALLTRAPNGRYVWQKFRYLGWPELISWKHEFPFDWEKYPWKWDGRRWLEVKEPSARFDPRYGERVASR